MVTVNMDLPNNCMDCKLGYDCCSCIITGRTFDFSTCENQRMDDCPLAIYHGLPQWHYAGYEDEWFGKVYTCSHCGEQIIRSPKPYCPGCGRPMVTVV